jgi:peptidoglycan-associated lipoprotein
VYYDFDKSDLRTDSRALIEANARYLREHPSTKVRIEGNADERGSAEYNLALGQRRAENVEKTLKLLGVQDSRMEAISYGKEKPRKTGHDEASWAENRRSDLVY